MMFIITRAMSKLIFEFKLMTCEASTPRDINAGVRKKLMHVLQKS